MSASGGSRLRPILLAAGSIAALTLVARIVGFGRWFVFSHSVGATDVGTVYQSVNLVPNVLYEVAAGGALAAIVVPLVAGALSRGDRREADETASALLTWVIVLLVPVAVGVVLAAHPIAQLLLGEGAPGTVALGADLLRIFAVQVPLYGVGIVLGGVLQSHRRFVAASLAPLLSSLVVIASYLTYEALVVDPASDVRTVSGVATAVLGVGTTLGVAALSLPLLVPVRRQGVRLRPRLRLPHGLGQRLRTLAVAGVLAVAGQQVAALVVVKLANDRGGSGTINVFTYAQTVMLLPYAVLAVPLATAAFPRLAGVRAESGDGEASADARRVLGGAWFATLAAGLLGTALVVAVSVPVGRFFEALDAGRDAAANAATLAAMGDALVAFAPSVLALAVIGLMTRASYVEGHAVAAGATAAAGWLGTTVVPLLALPTSGSDGPSALRAISLGSSVGLGAAALGLLVVVARGWGSRVLHLPVRPLVAVLSGCIAAATLGRVVFAQPVQLGVVGWGAAVTVSAVVAAVVAIGVASVVDPSLGRRLRPVRRAPEGAVRSVD